MKVLNAEQTRNLEKNAVRSGISYLQLMENAGAAAARFIKKRFPVDQKHIVVLCGKGNNGGDGFVAARHLAELGAKVIVVLTEGQPGTEIAREMFEKLSGTTVKTVNYLETPEIIAPMLSSADYIVDAIYGIGFHGSVPEYLHPLFIVVKSCTATVISLDIPSGVICDTGGIEGKCIRANYTVSFTTLKNAHLLQPGKTYCGQVAVVPVGITAAMVNRQPTTLEVTEQNVARAMVKPRKPESNKGSYGRLLCVCGSVGMAGAAVLSAKAAIRCGAGLVNVALPSAIYPIVASQVVEPVYTLLNHLPNGSLSGESERNLLSFLSRSTACLIGCGLGKSDRCGWHKYHRGAYRYLENSKGAGHHDAASRRDGAPSQDQCRGCASAPLGICAELCGGTQCNHGAQRRRDHCGFSGGKGVPQYHRKPRHGKGGQRRCAGRHDRFVCRPGGAAADSSGWLRIPAWHGRRPLCAAAFQVRNAPVGHD